MDEAVQKLIERNRIYLRTEEGQRALREALDKAREASRRFREASRVDPASLREPMDI